MQWKFWKRTKKSPPPLSLDMGNDPLDPHGDGTLREGDPMFDIMMGAMRSGKPVIARRKSDGTWDVEFID